MFSSSTMEAPIKEEKKKKILRQKYGHMASRNFYNLLRGCLSYFHPVNFASKIILPETLLTERLYLGKN